MKYENDSTRLEVTIDGKEEIFPTQKVKVIFGPHHFVDIFKEKDKIKFVVGVTHHGVMMDASRVSSELESFIWESKDRYPDYSVD